MNGHGGSRSSAGRPPGALSPAYAEARARREAAEADMAEMRRDEARRRLIDADLARREWGDVIRAIRDRILAVPDRIAAQLAAESDIHVCRMLVDDAVREALIAADPDVPPELSR